MKHPIISLLSIAIMATALTTTIACTDDETPAQPTVTAPVKMRLRASVTPFDAPAAQATISTQTAITRAATDYQWPDGAVVFLQLYNGTKAVRGHASYSKSDDIWSVDSWAGQIATSGRCEVYYFDGASVANKQRVTLSSNIAAYADLNGTYSTDTDGSLTVEAALEPLTSRLRLAGTSGLSVSVSGLSVLTAYDAVADTFATTTAPVAATVATDGFTPYIYATFAPSADRTLSITNSDDGSDMVFTHQFPSTVLAVGQSGYIDIPTESRNRGWDVVVPPSITVAETSVTLSSSASTAIVAVEANVDYTVASSASWLTATKTSSTLLTLSATENTSTTARTATVTLTGEGATATIAVRQAGVEPDPLGLCPNANHPHAIDLGLGVKFACCNVGASSPIEYGDYYAWGEIETKTTYSWSTYKYCNGTVSSLTKYNNSSSYGTVDNLTTLQLSDDVARAVWGGTWRMPTITELSNLSSDLTWTWTTISGVSGYRVAASNGNKIFLPAAGYRGDSSLSDAGSYGYYWSSSLYASDARDGQGLYFGSSGHGAGDDSRCLGQSVRPVTE